MAVYEHSEPTTATAESVWALWSDPSRWPEWDPALVSVTLPGRFVTGSHGRLRTRGGPSSSFRLTRVAEGIGFTDTSRLPLARLVVEHDLVPVEGGLRVRHRLSFRGPLGGPWSRLLGPRLAAGLPAGVRGLVRLAEQASGQAAPSERQ